MRACVMQVSGARGGRQGEGPWQDAWPWLVMGAAFVGVALLGRGGDARRRKS